MKTEIFIRLTLIALMFTAFTLNSFADATVCQSACPGSANYACENPCRTGYVRATTDRVNADADCAKNVVTNPASMCCCESPAETVCKDACSSTGGYICSSVCSTGYAHTATNTVAADANCGTGKMCCCQSTSTGAAACQDACSSTGGSTCAITCASGYAHVTENAVAADADCTKKTAGAICCCKSTGGGGSTYVKANCQCTCGKDKDGNVRQIGATGLYKPGFLDFSGTSSAEAKCQAQCGRTCGGFTSCPTDTKSKCSDCCDDYCANDFTAGSGAGTGGDDPIALCKSACYSTCNFRGTINGITDIIYTVAAIIGAIMLAIHGIRLVTSGDAGARESAKSSMAYVILALIIIALAGAAVRLFTNMGQNIEPSPPGPTPTNAKSCSDCTGSSCTADTCANLGATGGCYYIAGAPNPCVSCSKISGCGDYAVTPNDLCTADPCKVPGGCVTKIVTAGQPATCVSKGVSNGQCRACTAPSCTVDQCMNQASATQGCFYIPDAPNPCIPCSEIGTDCGKYIMTPRNLCSEDPCKIPGGCEPKVLTAGQPATCVRKGS